MPHNRKGDKKLYYTKQELKTILNTRYGVPSSVYKNLPTAQLVDMLREKGFFPPAGVNLPEGTVKTLTVPKEALESTPTKVASVSLADLASPASNSASSPAPRRNKRREEGVLERARIIPQKATAPVLFKRYSKMPKYVREELEHDPSGKSLSALTALTIPEIARNIRGFTAPKKDRPYSYSENPRKPTRAELEKDTWEKVVDYMLGRKERILSLANAIWGEYSVDDMYEDEIQGYVEGVMEQQQEAIENGEEDVELDTEDEIRERGLQLGEIDEMFLERLTDLMIDPLRNLDFEEIGFDNGRGDELGFLREVRFLLDKARRSKDFKKYMTDMAFDYSLDSSQTKHLSSVLDKIDDKLDEIYKEARRQKRFEGEEVSDSDDDPDVEREEAERERLKSLEDVGFDVLGEQTKLENDIETFLKKHTGEVSLAYVLRHFGERLHRIATNRTDFTSSNTHWYRSVPKVKSGVVNFRTDQISEWEHSFLHGVMEARIKEHNKKEKEEEKSSSSSASSSSASSSAYADPEEAETELAIAMSRAEAEGEEAERERENEEVRNEQQAIAESFQTPRRVAVSLEDLESPAPTTSNSASSATAPLTPERTTYAPTQTRVPPPPPKPTPPPPSESKGEGRYRGGNHIRYLAKPFY